MDRLADLIGQAPGIAEVRERIRHILEALSHTRRLPPILLEGETGTGKNLVASVIHRAGPRSGGPFVDVNCAAIPEGLLEAELFGFERGAFTDARHAKAGLFQAANGGTLFLDEIALLSDALQAKLLKVIEERAVRRLGSTRSESVDVSIVAATNENLGAAIAARRFRQDLYHRVAVLTLRLPSLRERRDDIPLLAEHFLRRACQDYGLPSKILTPSARASLRAYDWPGNVRELANVMERVALLTETARILPETLALPGPAGMTSPAASLDARVETWERQELTRALEETRWNVARAAAHLGITRGTIRYRIVKYGLEPPMRYARSRRRDPVRSARPTVAVEESSITPAIAAIRWERRLVALLQVTVRDLEADGAPMDFGRDFDTVVQKVENFSGRIEEAAPSRIVAAFGVDPAEDAPRRAALAAMAIRNALARVPRAQARRAAVTVAVHAEPCLVGQLSGLAQMDGDTRRRMAMVLEELGAHPEGDSVVVSYAARSLLGRRFDFDDEPAERGAPSGRGGRLLGYHQDRFDVGDRPGPFVGRERELAALRARWREALEGRGQIVAVVGEPGIGKSRLLFEFRRTFGDEPVIYLEGRGESYGGGIPYLAVIVLLRGLFRIDERDDAVTTGEKVRAHLLALDPALAPDVSPLLTLLDAPGVDPEWQALEGAQRRQRTLDALTRLVLQMSQARPILLVLEDLHWIDAETQAFLDRLVVSLPAARLLVLVSYRPEYRHVVSRPVSYTQLHLDPLPPASAEELVRDLVGDDSALRPLTRLLIQRTEGNPFFLEESVRTLIETRGLVGERGAYRPAPGLAGLEVPPTVRAVLAARVDRLPAEQRQVVQAAAVVGKDVPFGLVHAIAGVPEAMLRRVLIDLQAAEFLRETRLVPDVEYTFKHALTHEVVYETMLPEERSTLHARMVEALEQAYADHVTEVVDRLAQHALAAELWSKARAYCRQAGAKAAWRSAHREAVLDFEHALRAIRQLPETRPTLEETLDLHFQLRWSLVPLGESTKLAESLRDAEALAAKLDDRHRLGEISQTRTHHLRMVGDGEGALAAGQRARSIAVALGNRELEVRANYQIGLVYEQLGHYDRAIIVLGDVAEALGGEWIHERFGEPSVLSVHARTWLGTALAEVGRFVDAIATCEEAIRISESAKNAYSLMNAHLGLGTVYTRRGNVDRAIPLLERSVSLCREGNFQLSNAASALGAALALAGRVEEALPILQRSVEESAATGRMSNRALYLLRLGRAQLLARRAQEAEELAVRALDTARTYKERGHEAWAHHLHGEIAARDDSPDLATAERWYVRAMALAQELDMRPLIAGCHGKLGTVHLLMGQRDQAREHVIQATTMFREMGMQFWLEQIEAETNALGGT
jgi:transcriptional regulator with AAA-type ATPase domain/predicted ATPase